jgi:hypothetical protein
MVIWQCCDGSGTLDELARDLAEGYQADLETVRAGTIDSVRQMGRDGLLEGVQEDEQVEPLRAHDHGHDHNHDHSQPNSVDDQAVGDDLGEGPRFLRVPPSS